MARSLVLATRRLTSGVIAAASLCTVTPSLAYADAVTDWNKHVNDAVNATCIAPTIDPLYESRLYTMVHIAVHDALNAIDRRSRPYAFTTRAASDTSPEAAVAAAAREVLVAVITQLPAECQGTGLQVTQARYSAALAGIPLGPTRTAGIDLGRAAAAAILDLRADDGSDTPLVDPTFFPKGHGPGDYQFTPEFDFAFAPGWGGVTPFGLRDGEQFRPGPPLNLRSKQYAADFHEVKALGGDEVTGSARTAEQTEIARFWLESSPQQWNRIARDVSADRGLDVWENAAFFALLNVALADGYIASFATKYHYMFWRPVTAIHLADTDGNPLTLADPLWAPLQLTYPIPDYDSGHAVEGGAAAEVLGRFFGDNVSFSVCSVTLPAGHTCADPDAVHRMYTSFSQAAAENAVSRIYAGLHFRDAVEQGERHGRRIGALVVRQLFRQVK